MKEDLLKIIEHYGVMPQLKYFQSEVFELNEAILYMENHIQNTGMYIEMKKHIAEEIADVLVMLGQFKEYYKISDEDIKQVMEQKIARQLERIENETTKK